MLEFLSFCKPYLAKLSGNDEGQTGIEYVMLIVLVAIAAFVASPNISDTLVGAFKSVSRMIVGGMAS